MSSSLSSRQLLRLSARYLQKPILSRSFCNTTLLSAKNDSSSIDYFKFPDAASYAPKEPTSIKIPTLPDSWTNLNSKNPVETGKPKPTDEFQPGDVVQVAGSGNIVSKMSDTEPIQKSQSELLSFFESSNDPKGIELEEFSSKDKAVLTYLVSGVVAWWLLGSFFSKDEKEEDKKH